MTDSDLLLRLTAMRSTVRRRLVLYGTCVAASGGLLTFTLIVLLDWWLWLPRVLRLAVGALFALGFAVAASHWIIRPLRARFTLTELAGKLERRFPALRDSLTSTVSFLEGGTRVRAEGSARDRARSASEGEATQRRSDEATKDDLGSAALIRRVIDRTDRMVQSTPLEEALTVKPLVRCALFGLLVAVVVATIALASPGWYRTGLVRYALPLRPMDWPREVEVQSLQGDALVAVGSALPVHMRVIRGMHDDLRGIVHVQDVGGERSTFTMQREGAADFYCTIERIVTDLTYWFEAGDADTADTPCRVTVVKPPAVVDATVRVTTPAYAQPRPRPPEELDLVGGDIRAVVGSRLTVSVRSSKPIGVDDQGRPTAALEFDRSPALPLEFANHDPTRLGCSFELHQSDAFRIVLKGPDGFENDSGRSYRLSAAPDEPPAVTVVEPSAVTEITPTGSVTLMARAEDDFGIRQARLTGELINRTQTIDVLLADNPPVTPTGGRLVANFDHVWELAPLNLAPGDVVRYRLAVTDNYGYQGAQGQSTTSTPLRLKIISKAELENRLRDEFALLEARVRQRLLDQEAMRDELNSLADALGDSSLDPAGPSTSPASHASSRRSGTRRIAREQLRLADQLRRLAERFERVGERVRVNNAFDAQARRQLAEAAGQLERTASGSMTRAARILDRWADQPVSQDPAVTASVQRTQLSEAGSAQAAAAGELQQILRWIGQWGDFQEVVAKTRNLLDRQQQVRAAALQQDDGVVGSPVASLSERQRMNLRRIVHQEKQLAREMDRWLRNARSLIDRLRAKDPASAEALQGALRVAVAHRLLPRMENAAAALAGNRTAAASIEQRAVESGLTKVLATLETRQMRELAQLRKSVERMLDAVAELLRTQEALLAATQETAALALQPVGAHAAADAFSPLADEQRTVRRNTRQLVEEISESPPATRAAATLKNAVTPMERAERRLRAADGTAATTDQREAIASLQKTLEELERLAAETDHRLMQKTLAQIRRKLEEIHNRQQEVNETSGELVAAAKAQRRLSRTVARRAYRLAAGQADIRERTNAVRGELESVAVYTWVLDRVSETMGASREALAARRLNDTLLENQRWIVSELSHLIDAIALIEALPPPDEFADAGGGGGGAAAKNQPPVPPVAELIVIKTMQQALNAKTVAIHNKLAGGEPTEDDLRRARAIGREQEQLRVLTERVTRKARSGNQEGTKGRSDGATKGSVNMAGPSVRRVPHPFQGWGTESRANDLVGDQSVPHPQRGWGARKRGNKPSKGVNMMRPSLPAGGKRRLAGVIAIAMACPLSASAQPGSRRNGDERRDDDLSKRLIRKTATGADMDLMSQITSLMSDAETRLVRDMDPGLETRAVQESIVRRLDDAIKMALQQRARSRSAPSARGERREMPEEPEDGEAGAKTGDGENATDPGESVSTGPGPAPHRRGPFRESRRGWGHLPDRDRDELLQGIEEEFIEQYRPQIEQYYRALTESEEDQ